MRLERSLQSRPHSQPALSAGGTRTVGATLPAGARGSPHRPRGFPDACHRPVLPGHIRRERDVARPAPHGFRPRPGDAAARELERAAARARAALAHGCDLRSRAPDCAPRAARRFGSDARHRGPDVAAGDETFINKVFKENKIDKVCHLAAQAGVRYSLVNPNAYVKSNLVGFVNILEAVRHNNIKDFVYASSSSVYGNNKKIPFSVDDQVNEPISLYAATKKSNELLAYSYHHLFGINATGLRFFTVMGPYGRPDMAPMLLPMLLPKEKQLKSLTLEKCEETLLTSMTL